MKKTILFSILLLSISLLSCKKYLEVKPYDYVVNDDNVISDKASLETAVRGAYRSLATLNYGSNFQKTILLSGLDVRSINNGQTDLNTINFDLRSDIAFLSEFWSNNYNTINRANLVIDKAASVTDANLTPALKNQLIGEAYFIRALSYFDLTRLFGGVQIFLKPTKLVEDKLGVARSSKAAVYAQVLDDLSQAEALLPATVNRNRATKYAVYALRARIYLYDNRYEEAEAEANKVLAVTASYKLNKPFALAAGTTESILELSFDVNNLNPAFTLWNGTNRTLEPKAALHNLLNDSLVGGGRKILSKKTGTNLFGGIFANNTSPFYVLRTAEVVLIRAEARAKKASPDLTGALSDLNAVRSRSAIPNSTAVTQDEIILAIENERRVEFALEPHRWFDLVRTGRAPVVLNLKDPNKYIFPIPGSELRVDPSLTQNPGY